ncbi:MAG: PLP-dependent aminotransferase family protein [Dongiaceae bacterium]
MTIWQPDISALPGSRYVAIAEALAQDIEAGRLRAGDRLPTHRDLAYRLGVTVGTVTRAYNEAARRGLVGGEVGRGTYVRDHQRTVVPSLLAEPALPGDGGGVIDFSVNMSVPAEGERLLATTLAQLAGEPGLGALLGYQPHRGAARHRAAGAAWLSRRGLSVEAERVIVTAGGQHAMLTVFAGLTKPGDLVLTEALTYPGMKSLAGMLQLRLQGIAMDADGLLPEALEAACRAGNPRALYCMPHLQNPTGSQMPVARREAIAAIASAHGVAIVEDDVYGFLGEALPALSSLAPDIGYYLTSTSKSLAPGLRIGYLTTPPGRQGAFVGAVRTSTWMAAPLMAEIATRWIEDGTADRLAADARAEASARQATARAALAGWRWLAHPTGFHGWLELPEPWRAEDLTAAARACGVLVAPASAFAVGRPAAEAIRICLCATPSRAQLQRGLATVAELLASGPDAAPSIV